MDGLGLELSADLGNRRAPVRWASVAGPVVERQQVKQQRRHDLASGCFPEAAQNKDDGKGLDVDCSLRRRDEHLAPSATRATRACRAESIAQQLKMKMEPIDTSLSWLSPEDESGRIEYKYKLNNPHPIRLQQLITQMKYRISEGAGQCFYYLGVEDDGYPKGLGAPELDASIATLDKMAKTLRAQATLVRVFPGAHGRRCALLRVQRGTVEEVTYTDLRVAVAGCVDAGKSTLVAVLTHGSRGQPTLDTGRGSARVAVLRHKHEIESGRTSSLSQQLLGYDGEGKVLNYAGTSVATLSEVCSVASKVLTFIDMGGHERCLKTALYGLTALLPDYCLLCCCAVRGLGRMSREHLAVAVALHIPVAIVITKVDLVDDAALAATVQDVRSLVALAWPAQQPPTQQPPTHLLATDPTALAPSAPGNSSTTPIASSNGVGGEAVMAALEAMGGGVAPEALAGGPMPDALLHAMTPVVEDEAGAVEAAKNMGGGAAFTAFVCPILLVSSVSGRGIDVLHAFLHALPPGLSAAPPDITPDVTPDVTPEVTPGIIPNLTPAASGISEPDLVITRAAPSHQTALTDQHESSLASLQGCQLLDTELQEAAPTATSLTATPDEVAQHVHFQVDHTFEVAGVGSVVSGKALSGKIQLGQRLLLGPTSSGNFMAVEITGIQRAHIPVRQVRAGQAATLALKLVCSGPASATGAWAAGAVAGAPAGDHIALHHETVEVIAVTTAGAAVVAAAAARAGAAGRTSSGSLSDDDADDELCDGGTPGGSSAVGSFRRGGSWADRCWGSTPDGEEAGEPCNGGTAGDATMAPAAGSRQGSVAVAAAWPQAQTSNDVALLAGLTVATATTTVTATTTRTASGSAATRAYSGLTQVVGHDQALGPIKASWAVAPNQADRTMTPNQTERLQAKCLEAQRFQARHCPGTPLPASPVAPLDASIGVAVSAEGVEAEAVEVGAVGAAAVVVQQGGAFAGAGIDVAPDLLELFTMDDDEAEGEGEEENGGMPVLGDEEGRQRDSRPAPAGKGRQRAEPPAAFDTEASASRPNRFPAAAPATIPQLHNTGEAPAVSASAPTGSRPPVPRPGYIQNHTAERRGAPSRRPAAAASWCSRPAVTPTSPPPDHRRLHESRSALEACTLATSPRAPSFLLHSSSPSAHKGAVLLGVAGGGPPPRTAWVFEAVLVLLGGQWPARGLLSGRWPPLDGPASSEPPGQEVVDLNGAGGASSPRAGWSAWGRGRDQAAVWRAEDREAGGELDSSSWYGSNSCSEDVESSAPASRTGRQAGMALPLQSRGQRRSSWAAGEHGTASAGPAASSARPAATAACPAPQQSGPVAEQPPLPSSLSVGCRPTGRPDGDGSEVADAPPHHRRHTSAATPGGAAVSVGEVAVGGSPRMSSSKAARSGSQRAPHFTSVIHCANIRQLARLVSVQEVDPGLIGMQQAAHHHATTPGIPTPIMSGAAEPAPEPLTQGPSLNPLLVTPSMHAAAALMHAPWQPAALRSRVSHPRDAEGLLVTGASVFGGRSPGSFLAVDEGAEAVGGPHPDLGCIVVASFRFEHRPEWMREGTRLVVRDRGTGHVSAAGYVRRVTPTS